MQLVTASVLTCADQRAVVVQRSQVGARQREESVQFGQIAAEARPRQHRADDDVPQRVADEAVGRRQTALRERNLRFEWAAVPLTRSTTLLEVNLLI